MTKQAFEIINAKFDPKVRSYLVIVEQKQRCNSEHWLNWSMEFRAIPAKSKREALSKIKCYLLEVLGMKIKGIACREKLEYWN